MVFLGRRYGEKSPLVCFEIKLWYGLQTGALSAAEGWCVVLDCYIRKSGFFPSLWYLNLGLAKLILHLYNTDIKYYKVVMTESDRVIYNSLAILTKNQMPLKHMLEFYITHQVHPDPRAKLIQLMDLIWPKAGVTQTAFPSLSFFVHCTHVIPICST